MKILAKRNSLTEENDVEEDFNVQTTVVLSDVTKYKNAIEKTMSETYGKREFNRILINVKSETTH